MTESECKKLVAVLLGAFPSARIAAQTPAVYERMLIDLEYPAANAAIERLLATARWMPTVGEIRETTLALCVGEQKPGGEAWGAVLKAINREGYARTPGKDFVFADETTAKCVALMGWERLCSSENETADRARFTELYDRLAVQQRRKQLSEALPAMQRFKALEAAKTEERRVAALAEAPSDGSLSGAIGKVLSLVASDEPS